MAKEGIESFLLDCHTNDNLSELEAEHGLKGFAIIVRLWQKIYSEKGYYCEWTDRSPVLFLSNWFGGNSGVSLNEIKEVVYSALRIGIFHKQIYEEYAILTSEEVQKRYFDVVKRRTEIKVIEEYLLVSVDNSTGNVNRNAISVNRNGENVCRNGISKVKESKGKESKAKSNSAGRPHGADLSAMIEAKGFTEELEAAVKEWSAYKAEKRQGYKETGFSNLLTQISNKADEFGEAAVVDVIRVSMSNNWQGIIWDKIRKPVYQNGSGSRERTQKSSLEQFAEDAWRWAEGG